MTAFNVQINDHVVIEGEIMHVVRISGRWVYLNDNSCISRAAAQEARDEYLEDLECLGDELYDDVESELEESAEEEESAEKEEAAEEEAAEEEEAISRSIVDEKYRALYIRTKSANGNSSLHCGDQIALVMEGFAANECEKVAQMLNIGFAPKSHLNNGQRVMNSRNAIRRAIKDGIITMDDLINKTLAI